MPVSWNQQDLQLKILLQPKASADKIIGLLGDELKISITAPPVDGKANNHLIKFMAKQFKVSKSQVEIVKGQLNRHKVLQIKNPQQIPQIVQQLLQ